MITWSRTRCGSLWASAVVSAILTLLLLCNECSPATCEGGPPFEPLGENGDWQVQDYFDSQGIKSVKLENGRLVLEAELVGGHPNDSKGEVLLDLCYYKGLECCVPLNLSEHLITVEVEVPEGFVGPPPRNGVQVFVKDVQVEPNGEQKWRCQYGPWQNVTSAGTWTATLAPTTDPIPDGYTETDFNPKKIHIIGVKFGIGEGSLHTYSGPLYVNSVTVTPTVELEPPLDLPDTTPPPVLGPRDEISLDPNGFCVGDSRWFLAGANWRMLEYGQNFGKTAWFPYGNGASKHPNFLRATLDEARRAGVKILRVGLLEDGRTVFTCDGEVVGYDTVFHEDTRTLLDLALEAGMRVEFVLFDYLIAGKREVINGVCLRGRANIITDGYCKGRFLNNFLIPFLDTYGNDAALLGFDIINEPEWVVSQADGGGWEDVNDPKTKPDTPVPGDQMRSFISDCIAAVRAHAPGKLATVGVSCKFIPLVADLDLDYCALHHYPWMDPLDTYMSFIPAGKPWVLEEFPTRNSPLTCTDYLNLASSLGAAGALMWNLTPEIDDYTMDCAQRGDVLSQLREPPITRHKLQRDGVSVHMEHAIISAAWDDVCYVEADDRSSGMRIKKALHGLAEGMRADVIGTMRTNSDGERYIDAWSAVQSAPPNSTGSATPVGLCNRWVGGADWHYVGGPTWPETLCGQKGVKDAFGLNNIGLLVKVWGEVTAAGQGWFYIDDGSHVQDGTGIIGIYVDAAGLDVPASGSRVEVTGISSCEFYEGQLVNVLMPRSQSDIVVLSSPVVFFAGPSELWANPRHGKTNP